MDAIRFCLIVLCVTAGALAHDDDPTPVSQGSYLGLEPPGLTPAVFAPGVISIENGKQMLARIRSASE